jgi:hypothetical protein
MPSLPLSTKWTESSSRTTEVRPRSSLILSCLFPFPDRNAHFAFCSYFSDLLLWSTCPGRQLEYSRPPIQVLQEIRKLHPEVLDKTEICSFLILPPPARFYKFSYSLTPRFRLPFLISPLYFACHPPSSCLIPAIYALPFPSNSPRRWYQARFFFFFSLSPSPPPLPIHPSLPITLLVTCLLPCFLNLALTFFHVVHRVRSSTGTDVLKAICLGAKAVGMGRPFLYAQSAYKDRGVEKVIDSASSPFPPSSTTSTFSRVVLPLL